MQNERILESKQCGNIATIEIIALPVLEGAQSGAACRDLFYMKQSNVCVKMVRIRLNGGAVMTEAGALYYLKGNIENHVPVGGITGFIGKSIKNKLTNEKAFNPIYSGFGEVVLEPTFEHYAIVELNNEDIVVDKGLYYCSVGDIKVTPMMQKNVSSAMLGGEGIFQTHIAGSGAVVLQIPVPKSELEIYELKNEKLQVDGNFALLRTGNINFSVQGSAKGIVGTLTSGEGLLQTFEGTGQVWVAPTAPMYKKLSFGMEALNALQGGSNNTQ
jgi:uncharacterized protein (AIM24 family)